MTIAGVKADIEDELAQIFDAEFSIETTDTNIVPHSSDAAITFPNFDAGLQRCKIIKTCVLYVDMRRSTELSIQHRPETVAKLYSAFVRAMTYCAQESRGHVRGIIGDRIMVLFNPSTAFEDAIKCAQLMNSTAQHLLNTFFERNDVKCGIGIDYGRMLVTKTGVRKHGVERQNYHSLVWLGRPANVASKLTDAAHKTKQVVRPVVSQATKRVSNFLGGLGGGLSGLFGYGGNSSIGGLLAAPPTDEWQWNDVEMEAFLDQLDVEYGPDLRPVLRHRNPNFKTFFVTEEFDEVKVPPILMTKAVYDGFKRVQPTAKAITENWYKVQKVKVPGYDGAVYGGDVYYPLFKPQP